MKVAILSLVLHTNYGGLLQSYALQTVLERMGHEVEILSAPETCKTPPLRKMPYCLMRRLAYKLLKDHSAPIFWERKMNRERPVVTQHTQRFIDQYLHVRLIESFGDIQQQDYDAYVVGSDQVWRPKYFECQWHSPIENAFLLFTKDWQVKRIAYAPSFGVDNWEFSEAQTKACGELAQAFDHLSVREDSGIRLCQAHLHVQADHTLDPTMLLQAEDYRALIAQEPASPGDLLVYLLDEDGEKGSVVERIAQKKRMTAFRVNSVHSQLSDPLEKRIVPKVESWLKGFVDARLVVTDSFHACVFSILFGKPFVVLKNEDRGNARVDSLIKQFGLEAQPLEGVEGLSFYLCEAKNVESLRERSADWLREATMSFKKRIDAVDSNYPVGVPYL